MNIRRFARTIGFGRSTLRRDIDRVEHLVLLLAVVFFLLAVPLALLAGIEVRQSGTRTVATQPVAHQTVAVLLRDAPTNPNSLHTGQSAGNQVAEPETAAEVDLGALLTVVALLMCVLIGIGCGLWVVRHRLDRRRLAAWDADWRATEPNWTKRRG
ncbi:MAG TPA: hypothetical protein VGN81_40945 [Pseudonocardiaceae bacterium]